MKSLIFLLSIIALSGCAVGNTQSSDPTERGLSFVAGAIIVSAIIRAIFNK
jgi:hypothetical protein